jgi:hypothetical protein
VCEKPLPTNVSTFYINLFEDYDTHIYPPSEIWNCDEFDAQADWNGGAFVLAQTCSKIMHSIVLEEHKWLFVLSCINVVGIMFPNFYIFKGKCFQYNFITKCEFSTTIAMQPKAQVTSILFDKWISHFIVFIQNSRGSYAQPIITYPF